MEMCHGIRAPRKESNELLPSVGIFVVMSIDQ